MSRIGANQMIILSTYCYFHLLFAYYNRVLIRRVLKISMHGGACFLPRTLLVLKISCLMVLFFSTKRCLIYNLHGAKHIVPEYTTNNVHSARIYKVLIKVASS